MKTSYSWLKELVDFDWSVEELANRLTLAGLEVESIESWGKGLEKIIVGQIKKVEKLYCRVRWQTGDFLSSRIFAGLKS